MIFDDVVLSTLRTSVRERLSDKRYLHTLGVEEMAKFLGRILVPEKLGELCAAALLHDIAKELTFDDQMAILSSSDVIYTEEDVLAKAALHSIVAVPVIKRDFPEYTTVDIISAVANHTLGKDGMSTFDEIIFVSDYSEAGRTYPSCRKVREYLLKNISADKTPDENLKVLHAASLDAVNFTIESLVSRGEQIHSRTFSTKAYLESIIR